MMQINLLHKAYINCFSAKSEDGCIPSASLLRRTCIPFDSRVEVRKQKLCSRCRSQNDIVFRVSHFVGVSWSQEVQQWQARLQLPNGDYDLIGTFVEEEDAARAYDQCALGQSGPGAVRNFIPSTYTGEALLWCVGSTA